MRHLSWGVMHPTRGRASANSMRARLRRLRGSLLAAARTSFVPCTSTACACVPATRKLVLDTNAEGVSALRAPCPTPRPVYLGFANLREEMHLFEPVGSQVLPFCVIFWNPV